MVPEQDGLVSQPDAEAPALQLRGAGAQPAAVSNAGPGPDAEERRAGRSAVLPIRVLYSPDEER